MRICPYCSKENQINVIYCQFCGNQIGSQETVKIEKVNRQVSQEENIPSSSKKNNNSKKIFIIVGAIIYLFVMCFLLLGIGGKLINNYLEPKITLDPQEQLAWEKCLEFLKADVIAEDYMNLTFSSIPPSIGKQGSDTFTMDINFEWTNLKGVRWNGCYKCTVRDLRNGSWDWDVDYCKKN